MKILRNTMLAFFAALMCCATPLNAMKRQRDDGNNNNAATSSKQVNIDEQQVALLGRYAIPQEILIKNIMPHIILDLLAAKHGVGTESIHLILRKTHSKFAIERVIHYLGLLKEIMSCQQNFEESILKFFNFFDDTIISALGFLDINGPEDEDLKIQLISNCKNIKNQIQQLWKQLEQDTKAQLFNHIQKIVYELGQVWAELDTDFINQCTNHLLTFNDEDYLT